MSPPQTFRTPPGRSLAARGRVHWREGARRHAFVLRSLPRSLLQGPESGGSQVELCSCSSALDEHGHFCACMLMSPTSVLQGALSEAAGPGTDQGPDLQTG